MALTDGPASPLAPLADYTLYANTGYRFSANSDATVLALIEEETRRQTLVCLESVLQTVLFRRPFIWQFVRAVLLARLGISAAIAHHLHFPVRGADCSSECGDPGEITLHR